MNLESNAFYEALRSRDARFDGRFVTAVLTTGVYCRPVCPARKPRRKNVAFFSCSAAAEEAGFRPCKRCRPESSPAMPIRPGTSATASRALRLIAEGALDADNVEQLAARVGVGARQLRRLFIKHLGAAPTSIAQTRRVHFAKKLIDETDLAMTQVAFSAGFSSIRRFNAAFRKAFQCPPSELRRDSIRTRRHAEESWLELRLAYRPPLAWQPLIGFLKDRATAGVEAVQDDCYRRTIAFGDDAGVMEVRRLPQANELLLRVKLNESRHLLQVVERVRELFDLGADPFRIQSHLKQDPRLTGLVDATPGVRVPGCWDGFELAVRAIVGQQVSVKAATTLAGRIAQRHGRTLSGSASGDLTTLFPLPAVLANANLTGLGIVQARVRAIGELARAVANGDVKFDGSINAQDLSQRLCKIPGIGRWTAEYVCMRALREPDALPASDLGLRKAVSGAAKLATTKQDELLAERWRPWRAYGAMYLWTTFASSTKPQNDSGAVSE